MYILQQFNNIAQSQQNLNSIYFQINLSKVIAGILEKQRLVKY